MLLFCCCCCRNDYSLFNEKHFFPNAEKWIKIKKLLSWHYSEVESDLALTFNCTTSWYCFAGIVLCMKIMKNNLFEVDWEIVFWKISTASVAFNSVLITCYHVFDNEALITPFFWKILTLRDYIDETDLRMRFIQGTLCLKVLNFF